MATPVDKAASAAARAVGAAATQAAASAAASVAREDVAGSSSGAAPAAQAAAAAAEAATAMAAAVAAAVSTQLKAAAVAAVDADKTSMEIARAVHVLPPPLSSRRNSLEPPPRYKPFRVCAIRRVRARRESLMREHNTLAKRARYLEGGTFFGGQKVEKYAPVPPPPLPELPSTCSCGTDDEECEAVRDQDVDSLSAASGAK